jgi:hypothetical protein
VAGTIEANGAKRAERSQVLKVISRDEERKKRREGGDA